ncbi:MAG: low molecular weight protein-tyrosine-phosphatase [Flavobacteriaceae bacterium]
MRTRVLMVCLGNICRSPLAEGLLKSKVDVQLVFVDSAGTAGYHIGSLPDSRSIAVAKKNNIDITDQRCRVFTSADFLQFDLIYAMDQSNYSDIASMAEGPEQLQKVRLLLDETNLGTREVPDPYYGGERGFEMVFEMIDQACESVVQRIFKIQNKDYGQE